MYVFPALHLTLNISKSDAYDVISINKPFFSVALTTNISSQLLAKSVF
jgi:hypothetical protein